MSCAAQSGHLEAVKLLIEHKAAVDKPNSSGRTALHFACSCGHAEIAAFLLGGAQIDHRDEKEKLRSVDSSSRQQQAEMREAAARAQSGHRSEGNCWRLRGSQKMTRRARVAAAIAHQYVVRAFAMSGKLKRYCG